MKREAIYRLHGYAKNGFYEQLSEEVYELEELNARLSSALRDLVSVATNIDYEVIEPKLLKAKKILAEMDDSQ